MKIKAVEIVERQANSAAVMYGVPKSQIMINNFFNTIIYIPIAILIGALVFLTRGEKTKKKKILIIVCSVLLAALIIGLIVYKCINNNSEL